MSRWREYGSVIAAIENIREAREILEKHTAGGDFYFEDLLQQIETGTPYQRKEAFFKVQGLCHPKALGDTYVDYDFGDSGWNGWMNYLGRLQRASQAAYKKLEAEFETLTEDERHRTG